MYKKYYFNYKKLDNAYLITNDYGFNAFLSSKNFNALIRNDELPKKVFDELRFKSFIYDESNEEYIKFNAWKLKDYKNYLAKSTVLHIFVVSKNCNYNCIYCQAGNLDNKNDCLMNKNIAKKAVDIAFESPSKDISFEFQGGEPLTNFETIRYIIDYSKEKNSKIDQDCKKNITYNIVSNLSLLDDSMISFIIENDVYICTSIDGDEKLQNINRPFINKNSYYATISSLKKLQEANINVSALLTTTKYSLNNYKSIVDEYVKLNLDRICIRPLTNIGKANSNWEKIGYTPEEFVEFYKNALEYIIQVNKNGYHLVEGMASIFLNKIINGESLNYMELRSPCGAAVGQMAYYYDGNVFTCDEGRMLFEMGDDKFLLGNVNDNSYSEMMKNDIVKEACQASCLECSHICHSCAYMPYCGTCPVLNYSHTGEMMPYSKREYRCKINKGILDVLFSYIKNDKKVLKIFYSWL